MQIHLSFLLLVLSWGLTQERVIEWLSATEHDFGDIHHKEPAAFTFQFKNISDAPLVIDNIRPSCGCTAVDWEEAVIPPDSTGIIEASYDARARGYFRKSLKVYFRGQRRAEKLWLEGFVIE